MSGKHICMCCCILMNSLTWLPPKNPYRTNAWICNPCGIYEISHHRARPSHLWTPGGPAPRMKRKISSQIQRATGGKQLKADTPSKPELAAESATLPPPIVAAQEQEQLQQPVRRTSTPKGEFVHSDRGMLWCPYK